MQFYISVIPGSLWLSGGPPFLAASLDALLPVAKVYNQKWKQFIYWQETYKLLLNHGSTFGVVSPGFNNGRRSSWHGLIEEIEVLRGWSVSRPSFQTFAISDLNKLTLHSGRSETESGIGSRKPPKHCRMDLISISIYHFTYYIAWLRRSASVIFLLLIKIGALLLDFSWSMA